jgi:hypothetical protein
VTFTPEQLEALAKAGRGNNVDLTDLALDAATIKLTKGRLDTAEDGSTVVVRGGHDYDADTDTVTVKSATPDGLLVDADGEVPPHHLVKQRCKPLLYTFCIPGMLV